MSLKIPFNKPFIAGKELYYIAQAVTYGNLSGDGHFTQKCTRFLEEQFQIDKVLLTPSCTAALEMAAMLFDLQPGDEVILPSFTFVSTANAVARLGVRPVFVDIRPDTLNIEDALIEDAITERTKAIIPVHYAGIGCEMDRIMTIAEKYDLWVAEDAAQGVNAFYCERPLGGIGDLGCYSFHETKNFICGEGGALCVNDPELVDRAEIIRDKGTNRKQFFRGQVDKYTWVSLGSSYVPSELCSAFLYGQLEMIQAITERRRRIYDVYGQHLKPLAAKGLLSLPCIPEDCTSNYHLFYILLPDRATRDGLMSHLNQNGIHAVFHYVPLHSSPMGMTYGYKAGDLPVTEDISGRLLRLPLFYDISNQEQAYVVEQIQRYLESTKVRTSGSTIVRSRSIEAESERLVHSMRGSGMSPNCPIEPTENTLEILSWDSDHFGFVVGRLPERDFDDSELTRGLESARRANCRLVYWSTHPHREVPEWVFDEFAGSLVDRRAVYEKDGLGLDGKPAGPSEMPVRGYEILRQPPGPASPRLVSLGIAAGVDSRFRTDKRIRREQFESLYEIWVQKSTSRELADEVLVAVPSEGGEIGFITIEVRDRIGQIGLVAVAEEARCRGVGAQLVLAADRWMAVSGAVRARVVTQSCNQGACRLYSRLGYRLSELSNIYHFWPSEKCQGSRGSCVR